MRMENAELPQIPTLKRSASFPECTPGLVKKANWDPLYGSNDDLFVSQVQLAYIFQQPHSLPTHPLLLLCSHTLPSSYTLSSLLAYTPFFLPHTQSSTDVDEDIDYVLSVMDELTQELVKEGEVATPSQNSMISVLIPSPSRLFSLCLSLSLSLSSPPLSSLSASFPLPQSKQSWHSTNKASSLTKTPCVLPLSASRLLMLSAQFVRSEHFSQ